MLDLPDKLPIGFLLLRSQIISFVLVIHREEPNVSSLGEIIVNDSQPSTPAFPTPRVAPADLAQSSSFRDDHTSLWMLHESYLQESVSLIVQISGQVTCEGRSLDKFHSLYAISVETGMWQGLYTKDGGS